MKSTNIPEHFPTSIPQAVEFYHRQMGWAIMPLHAFNEGVGRACGKKPRFRDWCNWQPDQLTEEIIKKYFTNGAPSNIGCVVRPPHVVIDLDSKHDLGASVMKWLEEPLLQIPRERTHGGVHLHLICEDLPAFKKPNGEPFRGPLRAKLNEDVTAELYYNGQNIVLAPSRHASGQVYTWEMTGELPKARWDKLKELFKFRDPSESTLLPVEVTWPARSHPFTGDLKTLDVVQLVKQLNLYGSLLDASEGKHSIRCPWAEEHSGSDKDWSPTDPTTVVYEAKDQCPPGFKCLHASCGERHLRHLVEFALLKGIDVDALCSGSNGSSPADESLPQVLLPVGRSKSQFCVDLVEHLRGTRKWFVRGEMVVVARTSREDQSTRLCPIPSIEFQTEIERVVRPGKYNRDGAFVTTSISDQLARCTLNASQFRDALPIVTHVLDVPIPFIHEGKLITPCAGYDERLKTFLSPTGPKIEKVSFEEGRDFLYNELFALEEDGGFCWKDLQSRTHAFAMLLTPYCFGLMNGGRSPFWAFIGNREGTGKDCLAQIPMLVYTGRKTLYPPIGPHDDAEFRKRYTAALMDSEAFVHISNMKGHIVLPSLEAATDNNRFWADRVLGHSKKVRIPNMAVVSMSGNSEVTWTPDISRRVRKINLHFSAEEVNDRSFRHPDIRFR